VYREPDSMELEDSYADADPLIRNNHMRGPHNGRRSGHGPDGLGLKVGDYGPPQAPPPPPAMIGWHPDTAEYQMNEEPLPRLQDSEGTLVGDTEPQIITPPVESDNPLRTNIYHTREHGFDPNMEHRRGTPAPEYARQVGAVFSPLHNQTDCLSLEQIS
jgi:hypothetical protein